MNSEKVKEIKEKLKYCQTSKFDLLGETLTLINELESENEKLKECYKVKAYDKLRAENKKLKNQIAELEEDKEKWQRKAINYYEKAKSYGIECIIDTDIDEVLKECLGK